MPSVSQAVEEDDGGGVLPTGGHHHRLRHPVEEGLSAHTKTLAFTALSLGTQAAHTLRGSEGSRLKEDSEKKSCVDNWPSHHNHNEANQLTGS